MKAEINWVFTEIGKLDMPNPPQGGWLRAARRAVGLSLKRLGKLSGRTAQSIKDAEVRELDGSISIGRLREIGAAMDMELVYAFIPRGGTVENLQRQRAREKADGLLKKANHHMLLENQTNDDYSIAEETEAVAEMLLNEGPDALWT